MKLYAGWASLPTAPAGSPHSGLCSDRDDQGGDPHVRVALAKAVCGSQHDSAALVRYRDRPMHDIVRTGRSEKCWLGNMAPMIEPPTPKGHTWEY